MDNSISHNTSNSKKAGPQGFAEKINYTLYDISNAVNSTHSLTELYHSIYKSLNKLIALPNFFIALYDAQTRMINFKYFIDEYDENFPIIENNEHANSLTGEVIRTGRPLLLKENTLIERAKNNRLIGTIPKIWLGAPLIIGNQVMGAISIQHYTDLDYFSHQHLEILVCVAEQISIAIQRYQILEKLEKEKKTLRIITDHTHSIIFTINSNGTYIFTNPSHMQLGYDPEDINGSSFFDLAHPDNVQTILDFLERGIQGQESHASMAFKVKDKSGDYQTVAGIFEIIRNNDDMLEKIIFIGQIVSAKGLFPHPVKKENKASDQGVSTVAPSSFERLKTILIIEDEDSVREMTAKALKTFGYNTIQASDGEKGISIYQTNHHSIDAICLDIILPGISGADTFKKLLKISPQAKIIITSGHVTCKDQQKMFSNAAAYIEKPYQIMILKETLNRILR